jgi:hypothetical protein
MASSMLASGIVRAFSSRHCAEADCVSADSGAGRGPVAVIASVADHGRDIVAAGAAVARRGRRDLSGHGRKGRGSVRRRALRISLRFLRGAFRGPAPEALDDPLISQPQQAAVWHEPSANVAALARAQVLVAVAMARRWLRRSR